MKRPKKFNLRARYGKKKKDTDADADTIDKLFVFYYSKRLKKFVSLNVRMPLSKEAYGK
jgi:hypothetical protein